MQAFRRPDIQRVMLEDVVQFLHTESIGLVGKPTKAILLGLLLNKLEDTPPFVKVKVSSDVVRGVDGKHCTQLADRGGHASGVKSLCGSRLKENQICPE